MLPNFTERYMDFKNSFSALYKDQLMKKHNFKTDAEYYANKPFIINAYKLPHEKEPNKLFLYCKETNKRQFFQLRNNVWYILDNFALVEPLTTKEQTDKIIIKLQRSC